MFRPVSSWRAVLLTLLARFMSNCWRDASGLLMFERLEVCQHFWRSATTSCDRIWSSIQGFDQQSVDIWRTLNLWQPPGKTSDLPEAVPEAQPHGSPSTWVSEDLGCTEELTAQTMKRHVAWSGRVEIGSAPPCSDAWRTVTRYIISESSPKST